MLRKAVIEQVLLEKASGEPTVELVQSGSRQACG